MKALLDRSEAPAQSHHEDEQTPPHQE